MNTTNIIYRGELRTEATHIRSGQSIITDAPLDNEGKGEAFSPTDLVATALGTCMLTVMGIVAQRNRIDMKGTTAIVEKIMDKDPRRISEVRVLIKFEGQIKPGDRARLERAAHSCPVGKSLHADLKEVVEFIYS